ncbi:AAA family ATPase [Paenibacillus thermoaerophilus]|uniref:histidine kinase n=1 Tax=Paenibacillus thermoaerophilus TaxID=1215385 RepID=A0ABW2V9J4_9BACL|nr:AAA family ATPase [Paenibacillus thermoaerophilus]
MIGLPDYETIELLHESSKSLIYRARHRETRRNRIVKMLKLGARSADAARLRREYDIARSLEIEGVVRPAEFRESANVSYLIVDDFGGESLHRMLKRCGRLTLPVFLDMAAQLARIIGRLHRHKVVHKDINPQNIIVHPETLEVKLTGFGVASVLLSEHQDPVPPELPAGTLTHMSPEQTGRISRVVDYRSDFYSLGATFYEMLTGRLPFAECDSIGLIHAHIAKQPLPPHQLAPGVPQVVSDIVMKCMAKTAEERYQSAFGLEADLERCRRSLREAGSVEPFPIGERDRKDIFAIPQKLYGRDGEWAELQAAYARAASGSFACVLISGTAGAGKSSLAMELKRAASGGLFVSGKFDPFRRDVPYSGWTSALQQWVRQLLAGGEEQLAVWRAKLTELAVSSGQALTGLIPELELVIGKQPDAERLPAAENRHRLHDMFRSLLERIATREKPLVLLLDDIHWADDGSLELLGELAKESPVGSFLLAATYRTEEAGDHPLLSGLVPELLQVPACSWIALGRLAAEDIARLLAETMRTELEGCRELAAIVADKTGGNPFFVKQFLEVMHDRGLVRFHYERECWEWDSESLEAMNLSDHVIRLIGEKLERLSPEARHLLQAAACIGYEFSSAHVAALTRMRESEAQTLLRDAVRLRLIAPAGTGFGLAGAEPPGHSAGAATERSAEYRFLHDRIREYCYHRNPDAVARSYRLAAGWLLLKEWNRAEAIDDRLFEIVNHLNAGREWIHDESERLRLAGLNLEAGLKAKSATAYPSAAEYLRAGIACLDERAWDEHFDLAFSLHLSYMEAAYLSGNFEQAERWFSYLLGRARNPQERANVYNIMIVMCLHRGLHEQAVRIGMEGLAAFGVRLPRRVRRRHVWKGLLATRRNWLSAPAQSILQLPVMTDPEIKALASLMLHASTPSYFVNPDLYLLLMMNMIGLTLKHGLSAESANAFNALGMLLGSGLGQYRQGEAYGMLSLKLNERYPSRMLDSKIHFAFGAFINHWTRHIETSIPYLWRSYHTGIQSGDVVFAGYAITYILLMLEFKGVPLEELREFIGSHKPFLRRIQNSETLHMMDVLDRYVRHLESDGPGLQPERDEGDESALANELEKLCNQIVLQVFHIKKAMLHYLFGRYEDAWRSSLESGKRIGASHCLFHVPEHYFYEGLIAAELLGQAGPARKPGLVLRLRRVRRKLRRWAAFAPDNYEHMSALVEAEWMRLRNDDRRAVDAYERAIASARRGGFTQAEAIACERAALYYAQLGRQRLARDAMEAAVRAYDRWGARAKTRQLARTYPQLVPALPASGREQGAFAHTNLYSSPGLDLKAIIRTSQAISGEIVLERLLQKLMGVLMQTAGAERGLLILKEDDGYHIEAEGRASPDGWSSGGRPSDTAGTVSVLLSRPLEDENNIPKSLIHYVMRTMEPVTLDYASQDGLFTGDPYVRRTGLKSACCVPVVHQGQLTALMYLENNLATHAFTAERQSLIGIIAAQAAISIRNARLYTEMEKRVNERTDEIIRMEESRRNLFANISHDLGTPLTSIQGYVEAILDGVVDDPEARRKYLKIVLARVQGIRRLIKDLFQLSKMETRQLHFNRKAVPAAEMIREMFQKHELDTLEAGVGYRLDIDESLDGVQVVADEQRIGQVYDNLLYNALRYTPSGGQIRVSARLEADGEYVLIQVADTGSGIAAHDLPHIFERFYRGSKSRGTAEGGGSGLGLAIAREIVTLHDGEIWAESEPGQGSVFYFTLPVRKRPGQSAAVENL